MKKKQVMYGVIAAGIILVLLLSGIVKTPGKQAIVDSDGGSYAIGDVTDLAAANQALTPGGVATVTGKIMNTGTVTKDVYVQVGFYASQNVGYMAAVTPEPAPCVAEEADSVTAVKISGLAPGESQLFTIAAKVPTQESVLKPYTLGGATVTNWGDRFVQQVGVYEECGSAYYDSIAYPGVVVTSKPTSTAIKPESCESTTDCSGWLLGKQECTDGVCAAPKPDNKDYGAEFKAYYNENPLVIWGGALVLVILILSMAMSDPKPR